MLTTHAKFRLGQVVRHRQHPVRGVVFDVDPTFARTEDWYRAIPEENRPRRDQPFYHLLAEGHFVAYVSEQNLEPDDSGKPVNNPDLRDLFGPPEDGVYPLTVRLN